SLAAVIENAADFALRRLEVRRARRRRRHDALDALREPELSDGLDERALAARTHGDCFHDRHAERALERRAVEPVTALLSDIAHVQRDHHRPPDTFQIKHQPQVEPQVRRINDANETARWRFCSVPSEHHVPSDRLIQCGGFEAVGSRQVNYAVDAASARPYEASLLALHRHAGVIGDLLPAAGEAVEEGGLAAVGNPDERQARPESGRRVHSLDPGPGREISTQMLCASRRRRARVVVPMRTTNGSRPGRASARTSTCSPPTKPSSSKRRSSAVMVASSEPTPTTRPEVPGGSALKLM